MKCENCGNEIVGAAIVCRQCNHNNAQGRVNQWRARRIGDMQEARTITPLANAAPSERPKPRALPSTKPLEPKKSPSIPFEPRIQVNQTSPLPTPKSTSGALSFPASAAEDKADEDQIPAWRAQLREKVKESRERVVTGPLSKTEPDEVELDPNPIVEAALKRIRWAPHTPSALSTPRIARHGSQAAALAEEPELEPEVETRPTSELKLEPKPPAAPTPANPLLARRPTLQPVATPVNASETRVPLPARPTMAPKPEPKPRITTHAESGIEIKPAPRPETNTDFEISLEAVPKSRVTGELKPAPPDATTQTANSPIGNSGSLTPPRKMVETKIIEIPQSTAAAAPVVKPKSKVKHESATVWVRTLAAACDFEIIATAYLPLFAFYATLNTSLGRDSLAIMFFLLASLTFCYQLLTLTLANRTSGMALLNLRLVNVASNNEPVLFTQKFARAVAATAAFLCPPLNLIVMQSNHRRQTLPDLLSGTTLVEK